MKSRESIRKIFKPVSMIGLLAAFSLVLAACASAATALPPASSTLPATQPPAAADAVINVSTDPTLGKILVDGTGMTLYIFTKDEPDKSNCDAACLAKWPPMLTLGKPTLGAGVDAALVGSAPLADGTHIVTYNHMPLYAWFKDTKPGDTTGQGVGSVWYVISPDGKPVGASGPASAAVPAVEASLNVATDPKLGDYLVDGKGMSLYIFTKDEPDKSNCDAKCLANWPALLTQGSPVLGAGVDASQVGSALLADGTHIVTYDHQPLYYFIKDSKPGDITGQDVGGVWYLVAPSGQEIDLSEDEQASPTPPTGAAFLEPTINVASNSTLGQFLVDGKGMTLYIYTRDTADTSNCNAACLAKWPPVLTQGNPILGPGVDDSKVSSALLADGTRIVTYNHMPLYYWVEDTKPGDTTGQGVGSVWYVISPDGKIIGK